MVSKLSDVNINEDTALGRAEMYISIPEFRAPLYRPCQEVTVYLETYIYIRIYSKPVDIGVKFNEESFKKGLETLRSFLYHL